ncbi:MAG: ATP-binding cassette domain-containing protein [Fusobacteriaceae bacterium]|jgi:ATP-binding cassette subfamily F protein 3|nr:ATP-binding cassette domain-containing protein [Fusobacteriaceae bacterium]
MAFLQVNNLYMGFLGKTLFKDVTFSINERDKIGLIGINGAGKSTLLEIILGNIDDDNDPETNKRGTIFKSKDIKIGYLPQNPSINLDNTVFDELMDVFDDITKDFHRIQELNIILAENLYDSTNDFESTMKELGEITSRYEANGGYSIEYKIKQILNGLGVAENEWQAKIGVLSGGELSRVALSKILLSEPDLLILDEPTNHLDLVAIEWLEKFLKEYNKSLMLVSHDVYFLDNVVNKIFELENKTLKEYKGNYTDFVIQKEAYISGAVKTFDKEQEKIKKMEEFIRRYKAGVKSKQARGREKILNRMEKMENPVFSPRKIKLKFEINNHSVDLVLKIKNLSKSFDGKTLFNNISLDLYRGDRVGIIGKNGVGKSTLLKIVNSIANQSSGEFKIGEKVKIGYYDQNHQRLDLKASILDELRFTYDISDETARNIAGGFLFSGDDVKKIIGTLSGGERARIALMKMMMEKPNFLIFDEPTNHLDIYSREILIESLEDYEGTILVVSHDRNFLDCVVKKIYEINEDGASLFNGDYNQYILQRERKIENEQKEKRIFSYEEQKKLNSSVSSNEKKIIRLEDEINRLDKTKSLKEIDYNTAGIENNLELLMSLQKEIDEINEKILDYLNDIENIEEEIKNLKEKIF